MAGVTNAHGAPTLAANSMQVFNLGTVFRLQREFCIFVQVSVSILFGQNLCFLQKVLLQSMNTDGHFLS